MWSTYMLLIDFIKFLIFQAQYLLWVENFWGRRNLGNFVTLWFAYKTPHSHSFGENSSFSVKWILFETAPGESLKITLNQCSGLWQMVTNYFQLQGSIYHNLWTENRKTFVQLENLIEQKSITRIFSMVKKNNSGPK